jgi:hypothetical protein
LLVTDYLFLIIACDCLQCTNATSARGRARASHATDLAIPSDALCSHCDCNTDGNATPTCNTDAHPFTHIDNFLPTTADPHTNTSADKYCNCDNRAHCHTDHQSHTNTSVDKYCNCDNRAHCHTDNQSHANATPNGDCHCGATNGYTNGKLNPNKPGTNAELNANR